MGSIDERLQPGLVVINGTELLDRSDLLIATVDSHLQIFERDREESLGMLAVCVLYYGSEH